MLTQSVIEPCIQKGHGLRSLNRTWSEATADYHSNPKPDANLICVRSHHTRQEQQATEARQEEAESEVSKPYPCLYKPSLANPVISSCRWRKKVVKRRRAKSRRPRHGRFNFRTICANWKILEPGVFSEGLMDTSGLSCLGLLR